MMNHFTEATSKFLGPEADWARARIDLHDIQGLWGGQAITVWGSGQMTVERVGPMFPAERITVRVAEAKVHTLFQQFIAYDFLTITIPRRFGIPDEAHPQITLTNAKGQQNTAAKWAGQTDDRFDALYQLLVGLTETPPNISAEP